MVAEANKMILAINGGSSSIKFSIYNHKRNLEHILAGKIERIGLSNTTLGFTDLKNNEKNTSPVQAASMQEAVEVLMDWFNTRTEFANLVAIGHRIVFGMDYTDAQVITETLLVGLNKVISYDPDHLPGEIGLIKAFRKKYSHLPQVACFDTSFHKTLPRNARLLPIPRRYDKQGIRRYGFHGLSYSYLIEELDRLSEPAVTNGRVILAHLGNGASLAAVLAGSCIDTSMGFTPASGFMMGTRPGDLDPGVAGLMIKKEILSSEQFNELINHQCGLLGISETSSDMHDLLKIESTDIRAAEAVNLFCYQVKKWIGSFTVVLEGLDVLVFTAGIGQNSPAIRSRICEGLQFMGIKLDEELNAKNETVISSGKSKVIVYVIPTDEECMIAKTVSRILSL